MTNHCTVQSLAYHYIRSLVHRPAVCASTILGDRASSSVCAVASSGKCIIQILQLLEERNLCFSFCLNKDELLVISGFGLLFQSLDLDRDGKLMRDHQRMLKSIVEMLEHRSAPGARHFRKVAGSILSTMSQKPLLSRHNSDRSGMTTQDMLKSTQKQLKAIAARFTPDKPRRSESDETVVNDTDSRSTVPVIGAHPNTSQNSLSSIHSEPASLAQAPNPRSSPSNPALSPAIYRTSQPPIPMKQKRSSTSASPHPTNLDYLVFPTGPLHTSPHAAPKGPSPAAILRAHHDRLRRQSVPPPATAPNLNPNSKPPPPLNEIAASAAEWEKLITSLDQPDSNIYDAIYGGPTPAGVDLSPHHHFSQAQAQAQMPAPSMPLSASAVEAQNLVWDAQSSVSMHSHPHSPHGASSTPNAQYWSAGYGPMTSGVAGFSLDGYPPHMLTSPSAAPPVPQSVLSFSDESLSSGEEFSSVNGSAGGSGMLSAGGRGGWEERDVDVYGELDIGMLKIPADAGGVDDLGHLDAGFGL